MANSKKIDLDGVADFSDVVSTEIAADLKLNIDFLQAVCAVGQVAPILTGLPGVPTPDPDYWQECNGSEITNENSPLRSLGANKRYVPDMRQRYIMMVKPGGQASGTLGGENSTYAFRHNHGGITSTIGTNSDVDHSSNMQEARDHYHTVGYSFDYPVNVEPPHIIVKFFMRIQ